MKTQSLLISVMVLGLIAGCSKPAANGATDKPGEKSAQKPEGKGNVASTDTPPDQSSNGANVQHAAFKETFEGALEEAKSRNTLVMIDFWATWCGPCLALQNDVFPQPDVQERLGKLVTVKLDTDQKEGQEMGRKFGVEAIPVCLFLDADGKEVYRIIGNRGKDWFLEELDKALAGRG